jgi:p21-activated kinase 1
MLGLFANILKPNKRPEISVPHNPLHVTHVGFDTSTCKFTGLPKDWQRLEEDSGSVWDRMGHGPVPGSSQSPPSPGATHATCPGVSTSVNDSFVPTVSAFLCGSPQPHPDSSKQPALSPLKKSYSSDDLRSGSPSLSDQYPAAAAHFSITKDRHFPAPLAFFFF